MTCPVCGSPYPCRHSRRNTAVVLDPDVAALETGSQAVSAGRLSPEEVLDRAERERWRQEVASRVRQHRARRRKFDPNASLDLDFPTEPIAENIASPPEPTTAPLPPLESDEPATPVVALSESLPSRSLRPPKVIRFPKQSGEAATYLRSRHEDLELAERVPQ